MHVLQPPLSGGDGGENCGNAELQVSAGRLRQLTALAA